MYANLAVTPPCPIVSPMVETYGQAPNPTFSPLV